MVVRHFDTAKGSYEFQFEGLESAMHSHPAIEVLFDASGKMSVSDTHGTYNELSLAIIDVNVPHKVSAPQSELMVLMYENRSVALKKLLPAHGLFMTEGICLAKSDFSQADFVDFRDAIENAGKGTALDDRVEIILEYLRHHDVPYEAMLDELSELVHLSKSRLSHLFKAHQGLSLKKYLLWCKLRNTIAQHLDQEEGLFAALIKSGFYDQPHFSRAFKDMLGVNPAKAYNSRTVQL
jgi:AraC-like DNA-binding protein